MPVVDDGGDAVCKDACISVRFGKDKGRAVAVPAPAAHLCGLGCGDYASPTRNGVCEACVTQKGLEDMFPRLAVDAGSREAAAADLVGVADGGSGVAPMAAVPLAGSSVSAPAPSARASADSAAKAGLVDNLRTQVSAAGSSSVEANESKVDLAAASSVEANVPKVDLAAAARERVLAERKKEQSNFEKMRLKMLADDDGDEKPASGKKGKKKGKGKGTKVGDVAAQIAKPPSKVEKLRSEVAASTSASAPDAEPADGNGGDEAKATTKSQAGPSGHKNETAQAACTVTPVSEAAPCPAPENSTPAPEAAAPQSLEGVTANASDKVPAPALESAPAPVSGTAPAPASVTAPAPAPEPGPIAVAASEVVAPPPEAALVPEAIAPAPETPAAAAPAVAAAPTVAEVPLARTAVNENKVHVRYNHKNSLFRVVDGRLDFSAVDAEYCLSYVLKGQWSCRLKHEALGEILLDGGRLTIGRDEYDDPIAHGIFSGLRLYDDDGTGGRKAAQYLLLIQQDQTLASVPREAYKGSGSFGMDREGSRKEGCSCLWGNPCVSADTCNDFHNRFEVAKRNARKGI